MRTTRLRHRASKAENAEEGIVISSQKLWLTPKIPSGGGQPQRMTDGGGLRKLEDQIQLWQTPGTDSFRSRVGDRKDEMGLDQQARMQWVTPAIRDHKGANSELHVKEIGGGKAHMGQLSNQVEHSFLPDQATEKHGAKSSLSDPTSPRRLNPKFVEWLQGLPEGWTSAEPINSAALETWLCQCRELALLCCC